MSGEGRYGRLPKPKDKSRSATLAMGDVTLTPTDDKAGVWDEEEGDVYKPHPKPRPRESMMAKVGRMASEAAGAMSGSWSRFTKKDDEE